MSWGDDDYLAMIRDRDARVMPLVIAAFDWLGWE
jgi:hypothetical protein